MTDPTDPMDLTTLKSRPGFSPEHRPDRRPRGAPGRLTRRHWAECEGLWARGNHTLKELSEKFGGVRVETISQHMRKAGVVKGQSEGLVRAEVAAALIKRERKFAEQRAERIMQSREEMFAIARSLTIGVARVVHEAREKSEPLGIHLNTIKAHKEAIAAVKMGREEVYNILNYNPAEVADDDLPDLVVREMSVDEEQSLRNQQKEDDDFLDELRNEEREQERAEEDSEDSEGEPADEHE